MKFGIQAWGTRGDIVPMLALAQGLHKKGHEVLFYYTCITGVDFSTYSQPGLFVKTTAADTTLSIPPVPFCKVSEMEVWEGCQYILKEVYARYDAEIKMAAEILCACCDCIVISNLIYQTACIAEKNQIPYITVHVDSNYLEQEMHQEVIDQQVNEVYLERVNALRKHLGLEEVRNVRKEILRSSFLNLLIYSKVFEETMMERNFKVTGFLAMDDVTSQSVPEELTAFLNRGVPPVFFSLGSLEFFEEDPGFILHLFLEAIRLSGCRAIIQGKWENNPFLIPEDLDVLKVSYVPHHLVFPHCLCVVHHGGAGTTHVALLNGCPSIVIAYAWDQFSWGNRLVKMGACPGLLKRKTVDEIQLAGNIRNVMFNPEYKERAGYFRVKSKRENGVKTAVKLIEESVQPCFNQTILNE